MVLLYDIRRSSTYFPLGVTIAKLVLVPQRKLFWEFLLYLLIGQLLTHALGETEGRILFHLTQNDSGDMMVGIFLLLL
jgi:hypothetical protein